MNTNTQIENPDQNKRFKEVRAKLRYKQYEFGEILGLLSASVSDTENGRANVSRRTKDL